VRLTVWLLEDWPSRFVDACGRLRNHPLILGSFPNSPFWFWEVLYDVASHRSYSPTDEVFKAAMRYLRSRGRSLTPLDVSSLFDESRSWKRRKRLVRLRASLGDEVPA
jgi:hypothetical protein